MLNKLMTAIEAREYLGGMSNKIFNEEIKAGRILRKPYGSGYRYRKEDLDLWYQQSETCTVFTNVAKCGMRASPSSRLKVGWSLEKARENLKKNLQRNGV